MHWAQSESGQTSDAEILLECLGEDFIQADLCAAGGNNRVYRVQTARGLCAAKFYGSEQTRGKERLAHEFDGLKFLNEAGVTGKIPRAISVHRARGVALYEWIEGSPVSDHGQAEIAAALELVEQLHGARHQDGAARLPRATESVLSLSELIEQIDDRVRRLCELTGEPDLDSFLHEELKPELAKRTAQLARRDTEAELPPGRRTLSPSDFGFHNALRRPDGSLTFLDFEYFGWDDPVKLVADFLWHPGMRLTRAERSAFLQGARQLYAGGDNDFAPRLNVCFPLYGIRWALIILNEFVPQLWARRKYSGRGTDWQAAKRGQLEKARATLSAVRSLKEELTP